MIFEKRADIVEIDSPKNWGNTEKVRAIMSRLKRYKTNPFTAELTIQKKTKQVKVSNLGNDDNVLVNQSTGEVRGTHVITYKEVDDGEFIKLFTGNIALAFDLTSSGIKAFTLMSYTLQKQIEKDTVFLDELALEEFVKENPTTKSCSMKTIYRGISELENSKILAKSQRIGLYFINPSFVFNGNRIAFTTSIERKKKRVTVDENQGELLL